MKKLFRKNSKWSTEDKLLAGAAVVGAIGIFAIIKQKRAVVPAATAGLRGLGQYFSTPLRGLGAYFVDPMVKPINGLGAYRGR